MTLYQLLSTLTSSTIQVTIKDVTTDREIAVIKASSYDSLEDTIEQKEVAQWHISGVNSITVLLKSDEVVPDETIEQGI